MSQSDRQSRKKIQPASCSICRHPDRVQIELKACEGVSLSAIAKQFGPSRFAIARHMKSHVTPARRLELAGSGEVLKLVEAAAREDQELIKSYVLNRKIATNRMMACVELGDVGGINLMIARINDTNAAIAKLTGQVGNLNLTLHQHNVVNNFIGSPEFVKMVALSGQALIAFPEARVALMDAYRDFGGDAAPALSLPMIDGELVDAE